MGSSQYQTMIHGFKFALWCIDLLESDFKKNGISGWRCCESAICKVNNNKWSQSAGYVRVIVVLLLLTRMFLGVSYRLEMCLNCTESYIILSFKSYAIGVINTRYVNYLGLISTDMM